MARNRGGGELMGLKAKLDLDHPTGNFWVDNGLVVMAEQLGQDIEVDLEQVQLTLLPKLRRKEANGTTKWILPASSFIDAQKLKAFSERGEVFLKSNSFSRKATKYCSICNNQASTADIKQFIFPFLVEGSKFSNFLPGTNPRSLKICPKCAIASVMGYIGVIWIYEGGSKTLHLYVLYTPDLHELLRLRKEVLAPMTMNVEKTGNIRPPFYGRYTHETTLGLLFLFFSYVRRSDRLSKEGRSLLASLLGTSNSESLPTAPLTLYAITGTSGQAFNMQVFQEFSKLHSLYRLYESWLEVIGGANPQQALNLVFRQFQIREGNSYNTLWRDKIAWAVLDFSDPLPYIEDFLYEYARRTKEQNPGPLAWDTEEIFTHYTKEVLNMDEALLNVLRGFGHTLGRTTRDRNEMGLLYSLRNAKNPEDFYRVLNDAQFRLELTIPEDLLQIEKGEKIKGSPWVRIKTLLSIYAMNTYLWAGKGSSEQDKVKEVSHE